MKLRDLDSLMRHRLTALSLSLPLKNSLLSFEAVQKEEIRREKKKQEEGES